MATDSLTLAKAHQERNANKSRRDLTFDVGDRVLLNSQHVHLASQALRPSKKLQHRFIGPYTVISKVSPVAYKLALPPDLRIHPVFHVSLLRPYMDPASVPYRPPPVTPPPAVSIDGHQEYEVDRILDVRTRYRRREFLVHWVGYPAHDATWEPESNLPNAADAVRDFFATRTSPGGEGSNVMGLHGAQPEGGTAMAQHEAQLGHSAAQHVEGTAEAQYAAQPEKCAAQSGDERGTAVTHS